MRFLIALLAASGCRLVTTESANIARPRRDPDRVVVLVVAPAAGRVEGYHDQYVALEQRLLVELARDPHIEVKPTPAGVDACAVVDSGAADAIVQLDVSPKETAAYGFFASLETCTGAPKDEDCHPRGPATWTSSVAVVLTVQTPVLLKGRSTHFCAAKKTLGAWQSATVAGSDTWQPLVGAQLSRAGVWIATHLDARVFGVDTKVHAGELAVGTTGGVRAGDMFSVNDRDTYAIATNVTPTTTQLEPLTSEPLVDDTRVVDQGTPWALAMQPHGGAARLDDTGGATTAPLLGFDVRLSRLASGPIFGVGYDAVLGAHHDLMFAGPQLGWSMRLSPMFELHAIGELDGGIDTATKLDGTHALGARGTAALGATLNTRSVFTSLEVGYAYSSELDPGVAERGPFARLAFGFSAFH